ncbi:hypothetical protein [Catellatospora chokoriensis]|uniref:hypothetical protein n=1 Tax=Catellatospora chokoriensis TaxID=310353 RepID=UPI001786771A|nr:hypothetical protein [Catellatospora chokoriensis]
MAYPATRHTSNGEASPSLLRDRCAIPETTRCGEDRCRHLCTINISPATASASSHQRRLGQTFIMKIAGMLSGLSSCVFHHASPAATSSSPSLPAELETRASAGCWQCASPGNGESPGRTHLGRGGGSLPGTAIGVQRKLTRLGTQMSAPPLRRIGDPAGLACSALRQWRIRDRRH